LIHSRKVLKILIVVLSIMALFVSISAFASETQEVAKETASASTTPWWVWPLALFVVTFILGILAVLGGVGGGVLFVPIIGGFFPFNIDFVRGAGLLVAAVAVGAMIGLALKPNVVNTLLGATILFIVAIMITAKKSDFPNVAKPDNLSQSLHIMGIYREESLGKDIEWQVHRTPQGLALFIVIGVMAGMFGLGAGWANVPVLNLLMGAPLKISVATSKFLLSITDTSAAWVYLNQGAVLPMIVVPSIVGIMLGSIVGVKILVKSKPKAIKSMVIGLLFFAGTRALLKGLGIWE